MKISLSAADVARVSRLEDTRRRNFRFAELMDLCLSLTSPLTTE